MDLAFDDLGTGPAILLLHAFPLSGEMWKPQIANLAEAGFRAIIPDFPGFGRSDSLAGETSIDGMAVRIASVLAQLNLSKVIVCGLSLGGYVTFGLLRLVPEKLAALVLCDTTPLPDTSEKRRSRFELIDRIEEKGPAALIETMLPNLISDDSFNNDAQLVRSLERRLSKVNPQAAIATLRAMADRKDSTELLSQISVPTALIFGRDDKITTIQTALALQRQIRHSDLFAIPDAGHLSNLERPQIFNRHLIDFCRKVSHQ